MKITTAAFGDHQLFTIENENGMTVKLTDYGATLTSIITPDRKGNLADVALGFDNLADYKNPEINPYFGSIIGRFGNRIASGQFILDGKDYTLAVNNGPNHLHGGLVGFDKVVWASEIVGEGAIALTYTSPDGDEGYPGELAVKVIYSLTNKNEVKIEYTASTDAPTHINLTNHSYFNLKGEGEGDVLDHEIFINAQAITPVDENIIPTGEFLEVTDTPFDFTKAKTIGRDIEASHQQIQYGAGYDHNFVINQSAESKAPTHTATVYEPTTGRVMDVYTQEPGVQFYTGNFLDGKAIGKSGKPYERRGGFCLETQHYPDTPNQPTFPITLLQPGEVYQTSTMYRFSIR